MIQIVEKGDKFPGRGMAKFSVPLGAYLLQLAMERRELFNLRAQADQLLVKKVPDSPARGDTCTVHLEDFGQFTKRESGAPSNTRHIFRNQYRFN